MVFFCFVVRETGLEPVRCEPHAPQTCASASSATLASATAFAATDNIIHDFSEMSIPFLKIFKKLFSLYFHSHAHILSYLVLWRYALENQDWIFCRSSLFIASSHAFSLFSCLSPCRLPARARASSCGKALPNSNEGIFSRALRSGTDTKRRELFLF